MDVLKDKEKLNPEVRDYLDQENQYTELQLKSTKDFQKKLFDEIKGRIKLDDESLPYKDHTYEYWTKTTSKGNYSIKLRKKIGTSLKLYFKVTFTKSLYNLFGIIKFSLTKKMKTIIIIM